MAAKARIIRVRQAPGKKWLVYPDARPGRGTTYSSKTRALWEAGKLARKQRRLTLILVAGEGPYGTAKATVHGAAKGEMEPLRVAERRYVNKVLELCGRNYSTAAQVLGIARSSLYRKLRRRF